MYCPSCGHENRENAKFCVGCGVRSRLDVATAAGLTPLVGRTQEVGALLEELS
jgi:hypothetical protein